MAPDLRQEVRESGLTYEQIAFGAGVTLSWLSKYMAGRISDPGVARHDKVLAYVRLHRHRPSKKRAA